MYKYKTFKFTISNPDETDLVLVSVEDERTGFIVRTALPNAGKQSASIMAFAGARFSRSDLGAEEIFREVKESGKNAQEKLANIFNNYGHSSVGDLAQLFAYIEQVPDNYHVEFFYDSRVGAGQARSTRFQDFSKSHPPMFSTYVEKEMEFEELENEYLEIYKLATNKYSKLLKKIKKRYTEFYKPEKGNAQQDGALNARSLDTARVVLPTGANTSLAYITSAREWARMISHLKSDDREMIRNLGEQLDMLFAPPQEVREALNYTPEAPDLIKHTEADNSLKECLCDLNDFLEDKLVVTEQDYFNKEFVQQVDLISDVLSPSEVILYQYLLTAEPNLSIEDFKTMVSKLSDKDKKKISKILFGKFDHHCQLGRQSESSAYSFRISATFSELKDLNRHRAWARFAPVWETKNMDELLNSGYVLPLYLQVKEFEDLKGEVVEFLEGYYERIREFLNKLPEGVNQKLIINLLPSGHRIDYFMHASPKEISYLTKLRIRPGGHINYRMLAYLIGEEIKKADPLLSGLGFKKSEKPNPASREEFFNRG